MYPPLSAPLCRTAPFVALLALGCAGPEEDVRPASVTPPPPAESVVLNLGYDDAVKLGAAFAQSRGYQMELAMAEMRAGSWWLKYLSRKGQPRLELRVDARTGQVEMVQQPSTEPSAPAP